MLWLFLSVGYAKSWRDFCFSVDSPGSQSGRSKPPRPTGKSRLVQFSARGDRNERTSIARLPSYFLSKRPVPAEQNRVVIELGFNLFSYLAASVSTVSHLIPITLSLRFVAMSGKTFNAASRWGRQSASNSSSGGGGFPSLSHLRRTRVVWWPVCGNRV